MDDTSAEGAAAAASYFVALYPYVYATGDLADWVAMSSPECIFCSSTRDGATRVAEARNRIEGGEVTITEATGVEVDPGRWYSAKVRAEEAPSVELNGNGETVTASDGGAYVFTFALTHSDAGWVVDAVDIEKSN